MCACRSGSCQCVVGSSPHLQIVSLLYPHFLCFYGEGGGLLAADIFLQIRNVDDLALAELPLSRDHVQWVIVGSAPPCNVVAASAVVGGV
jgi:hypothetical protein